METYFRSTDHSENELCYKHLPSSSSVNVGRLFPAASLPCFPFVVLPSFFFVCAILSVKRARTRLLSSAWISSVGPSNFPFR